MNIDICFNEEGITLQEILEVFFNDLLYFELGEYNHE